MIDLKARMFLVVLAFCTMACGFSTVAPAHAQLFPKSMTQKPIPVLAAPQPSFMYPQHETLTFTVDWRVFTAGTAVFHLDQAGDIQKISATADSQGGVNLIFPVVDKFNSGFDVHTGCSTGLRKR